jgi:hypothetical protein
MAVMRFDQLQVLCFAVLFILGCGEDPVTSPDVTASEIVEDQGPPDDGPSGSVKLSVFKTGDGGLVRSEPAGIECGNSCFAEFPVGTEVRLFVEPDNGYRFMGFGGDCEGLESCILTMDETKEVGVTWKSFAPALAWATVAGGSGDDTLTAMATSTEKAMYTVGMSGSADFSWDEESFADGGENGTFFLSKVSEAGALEWHKDFVRADTSCPAPLVVSDTLGNAIVAGVAGEGTDLNGAMGTPSHGPGTFIAQYAPDGTLNWYSLFEGGCINAIHVNAAGQIAIVGKVRIDNANFGGDTHPTSANATSAFVAVFEATGLTTWSRVFATQELDVAEAYDVLLSDDGPVTLISFFQNTGSVSFGGEVMPDGHAMAVARFDVDGAHLWSKPFGGVYSHLRKLIKGAKGTFYVAGWESPGAAQENFIARLSSEGEETWRMEFPLQEKQEPVALMPTSDGFFFVGRTYDPYEFQENFFLLRLTEDFVIEYSLDLGGLHADFVFGAALTDANDLVLAGSTNSAAIHIGDDTITNDGGGKDTPAQALLLRLTNL